MGRAIARRHALLGLAASACVTPGVARAVEVDMARLITVRRGDLPIILTAPHGGGLAVPGVRERDRNDPQQIARSRTYGGVVLGADLNTDLLAQAIADEIRRLTGKSPSLTIAHFARRFIDANRPPDAAFSDPAALPVYRAYHDAIRTEVDVIRERFANAILIDIHGQGVAPDVLMRGTVNGRTVSRLVARAGIAAMTGDSGLFGRLQAEGFGIFPQNDAAKTLAGEDSGFRGGYTVATYGSNHPDGIDAAQWELGSKFRQTEALKDWAAKAARAIVAFQAKYL